MIELIGRLHPAIVHIPIGVFILAFILQYLLPGNEGRYALIRFMLLVNLFFSIMATAMGWILSWSSDYPQALVDKHKWPGVFFALATALLIPLQQRSTQTDAARKTYHGLFALSLLLLLVTVHRGASLTHGEDYLGLAAVPLRKPVKAEKQSVDSSMAVKPKEISLPSVPAPDSLALVAIVKAGFHVIPIARESHLLEINAINLPGLKDADLALLKPVAANILWLHLGDRAVTDEGLKQLGGCRNLRRLDLRHSKITDASAAAINTLSQLEYLNLVGTSFSDAGLAQLKQLSSLKSLYCWETGVTPAGVEAFKRVHPGVKLFQEVK
jgi:uncharacterized membrane protein